MTHSPVGILSSLSRLWSGLFALEEDSGPTDPPLYRLASLWLMSAAAKEATAVLVGDPPDAAEALADPDTRQRVARELRSGAELDCDIAGFRSSPDNQSGDEAEALDPTLCGSLRGVESQLRVWLRIDGRHEFLCSFPASLFAELVAILDARALVGDFGHGHARLTPAGQVEITLRPGLCAP